MQNQQQQQQQQQQQLLQLLASVTNRQTSSSSISNSSAASGVQQNLQQQQQLPPHQQPQELSEARIQLAIQQAVNPFSSGSLNGSTSNLLPAPRPLYSSPASSSTVLTTSSFTSGANTVTNIVNGDNPNAAAAPQVANILQSLASQTAQMQSVINALMEQQAQQQQQQSSTPSSVTNLSESLSQQHQTQKRDEAEIQLRSAMSSSSISSLISSDPSPANAKLEPPPATYLIANSSASTVSSASSVSPSGPTSPSPSGSSSPTETARSRVPLPPAVGVSLHTNGLPSRLGPYSLAIVAQPELNHRARYLTEGSRGSVKDRSHQGYPAVQLNGWFEPVQLCVFVAADSDSLRPHSHYQACRVAGKTTATRSVELDCEGTRVLVINCDPRDGNVFSIDCIGILKLRNVDVGICSTSGGSSGGGSRSGGRGQKRSYYQPQASNQKSQQQGGVNTQARLVFRVCLGRQAGLLDSSECSGSIILQVASETIVCTQPVGAPEVLRVSSTEGPSHGGSDLFLIGKNFARGCRVIFRETRASANDSTSIGGCWEAEAAIESDYFTQAHLICRVPAYRKTDLSAPITVQVTVRCDDRRDSEPFYYTYKPAPVPLRVATPSETIN